MYGTYDLNIILLHNTLSLKLSKANINCVLLIKNNYRISSRKLMRMNIFILIK